MKNKLLIALSLIVIISTGIILIINNKPKPFHLEEKYYINQIVEINSQEYNKLIKEKASFIIALYKPNCGASTAFLKVLEEYSQKHNLTIYKMTFSEMKKTSLQIKYYPSSAIINNGKLVDYLESDKERDTKYYKTSDGFHNWIIKYIIVE